MNPLIFILLIFACLGFFDKIFSLHLGLAESFDQGLSSIAPLSISIVGICSVGVTWIEQHLDLLLPLLRRLPFDPTLLIGALLAPDIGGFSICAQLTSNHNLLLVNGVVLTSILGQTISFQLPIFLSSIPSNAHAQLMKGCLIGITLVPLGLLVSAVLSGLSLPLLLSECIPIGALCLLIFLGLVFFPKYILAVFSGIARSIQIISGILLLLAILGIFIPALAYASPTSVCEAVFTCFKIAIIVSGSLVLSELVLKYGKKGIKKLSLILGINETAVIGLLLSCATSLAMVPLYSQMDEKGKCINAAFSVSGAFFLGGQLGYIASMTDSRSVTIYLITKILCGVLSIFIVQFLTKKKIPVN